MADLNTLFAACFPLIREKCRRMLSDSSEAEDIAQETFLRLWQAGPKDAEAAVLTAWVYRTSTHLAIDRLRVRRHRDAVHGAMTAREEPRHSTDGVEVRQQLERLAREIPPRELEVALLHRLDGLSQPQIAEITQSSERSVRRLLQKVDARLDRYRREELS